MTSHGTARAFTLGKLRGIGAATLNRLVSRPDFVTAPIEVLASWEPAVGKALDQPDALARAEERAAIDIDATHAIGARIVSPLDPDYPPALFDTPDRPACLFVKGAIETIWRPGVCVIGTREPTRHGVVIAQRIAEYFAARSWPIVSGLAVGIDAAAHEATLDAHGHTVAVLAHGLDIVYPKKHADLAERIVARGGALVSEYPPGTKPFGPQFVKRDRVQAGLSLAVILVQTDVKGGSLHASRAILQYGRFLAVPAPTPKDIANGEPKVQGVLKIIEDQPSEVTRFLECSADALRRVIVFRSRDDYRTLEQRLTAALRVVAPTQRIKASPELPLWGP